MRSVCAGPVAAVGNPPKVLGHLIGRAPRMAVDLPLTEMTLDDKPQAMELLWAELSKAPEQLASPAWHRDVLRSRRGQVQQGKASFLSWGAAMGELRAELHGHQAP